MDIDEVKESVEEAVEESDEINEENVIVGEPMTVEEFGQLLKGVQEQKENNE